jgi:hypothetical protein
MLQLIRRAARARAFEKRVPVAATGRNWLVRSWLALLCAGAATAFAQDNAAGAVPPAPAAQATATAAATGSSDPQTGLMTVVEPKVERDPTSLAPLGDDFSPTTGTITFSANDISIPGNFAILVELRRWVTADDADTGGPAGWKWNIPLNSRKLPCRQGRPHQHGLERG